MSATCRSCGQTVQGAHQCPGMFANRPVVPPPKPVCETCRYSAEASGAAPGAKVYVCQRFPPTPVTLSVKDLMGRDTIQIRSFFPPVEAAQTCGEWKGEVQ